MLPPITKNASGTVFDTINIYAPHRNIFLLTDVPHLLKTLQNCLYQSGRRSKTKTALYRNMKKNGQSLLWSIVERFYHATKRDTIRKGYKLNEEDVYLTSYSIMRVSLAAHVLSRSFATEIRLRKWEDSYELANYYELINDTFDMLNGKGAYQDIRTKNELLGPYTSPNDPRFNLLLEKWKYFEDWLAEVKTKPGKASDKAKMIISKQSLQGLERIIKGFIGAVSYTLSLASDAGAQPKILARYFQQDDLEHYFSKQRSKLGGNRHPDFNQALQSNVNIHQQSELGIKGSTKGNTAVNKNPSVEELSAPIKKRKRVRRPIIPPEESQEKYREKKNLLSEYR